MELEFFQGWFLFFFRRKIKVESVLKKIGKVLKKNEHGILKTDFSSRSMGEIFTQGNRDFYCFPKFLTSGHFSVGQKSLYFESILVPKEVVLNESIVTLSEVEMFLIASDSVQADNLKLLGIKRESGAIPELSPQL